MTTQKVFVGRKKAVEVVCPECDKSLTLPVGKILKLGAPVPARCICGAKFSVVFERRANYRKTTGLPGRVTGQEGAVPQTGEVMVTNLSRSGLGLEVPAGLTVQPGEILKIDFKLDNQEETLIRAQIVVKNVQGAHIGGEFASLDEHTRKLLGFYLMA